MKVGSLVTTFYIYLNIYVAMSCSENDEKNDSLSKWQ